MKPSEIVDGAIKVLHERGWTQYKLEDENGRVSLYGACNVAMTGDASIWDERSFDPLTAAVLANVEGKYVDAADWNNKPERTVDEVIGVLKLAREDLRLAGS